MSGFLKALFSGRRQPPPARPPAAPAPSAPAFPVREMDPSPPPASQHGGEAAVPPQPLPPAEDPGALSVRPPADPDAVRAALAEAAEAGDRDEVLRLGTAMRSHLPDAPEGYVLPARVLRDQGELDRAEELLAAAPPLPPDLLLLITRAEVALARRDLAEARIRAQALIDAFPDHAIGLVLATVAARELGLGADAERLIGRARLQFPDDLVVLITWAETAARRRDWAYAALRAAELRAAFPEHRSGYAIGAEALHRAGRMREADAVVEAGGDRLPEATDLLADWARRALQAERWPEAQRRAALLRQREPTRPEGYALGVQALRGAGALEAAKALAARAFETCPPDPALFVARAEVAFDECDWPGAEEAAAWVRREHPDRWIGWFLGARALMEQGRDDEADALLAAGRGGFPPEPAIEIAWTDAAMRRGDWTAAAARAERTRSLFPDTHAAATQGVGALIALGRLDEAAALTQDGARRFPGDPVIARLAADVAAARRTAAAPAPASSAAAEPPKEQGPTAAQAASEAALREGRFEDALRSWHVMAEDEQVTFPALLDAALRISLADPWHEGVRPLLETLGAEQPSQEQGWRATVEHAPRVSVSPQQFHAWREASAAFLSEAGAASDPETRRRWLQLVR